MQIVREFLFEEESCAICGIGAHNAHEILRLMMAKGKLVVPRRLTKRKKKVRQRRKKGIRYVYA